MSCYISLLGKSLTFHGQQRVGDLMARATNDVRQINYMASPGISLLFDSAMGVVVPVVMIGTLRLELVLVPLDLCRVAGHHLAGLYPPARARWPRPYAGNSAR